MKLLSRTAFANAAIAVGLGMLLHVSLVALPSFLARQAPPSERVLQLTAPDAAPAFGVARKVAARGYLGNARTPVVPAAPERE